MWYPIAGQDSFPLILYIFEQLFLFLTIQNLGLQGPLVLQFLTPRL